MPIEYQQISRIRVQLVLRCIIDTRIGDLVGLDPTAVVVLRIEFD
jgi:hypothetical protein